MKRRIWGGIVAVVGVILIAAGLNTSQTLVILGTTGWTHTLRCGTAFHRDEDAAENYKTTHGATSFLRDLGASARSDQPDSAASDLASGADDFRLDLNTACSEALSAKRVWSLSLWGLGGVLILLAALVWCWKGKTAQRVRGLAEKAIEDARFPRWMRQCRDSVSVLLTLAVGFTGLFTSILKDTAQVISFVITGVLILFAFSIAVARDGERRRQDKWIKTAEQQHQESLRELLGRQLYGLLVLVTEAVSTNNVVERAKLAHSTRVAIVAAAASLVGPKATGANRAHLFKFDPAAKVMALEPGCFSGGDRSRRIFRPGDHTYDETMKRKGVIVEDTSLLDEEEAPGYAAYITYAVHSPAQIHGVLTVDCLQKDILSEEDDKPMMSVLARLIAITYECEKYPRPRG
ncbi:hypothetical protein JVX93_21510 [Mycolicibacterium boenickei]|nr:hypothetical protein JVX93_21510 [Mycolicibacterium boenickei]